MTEKYVGGGSLLVEGNAPGGNAVIEGVRLTAPRHVVEAALADGAVRYQPTEGGPWVTLEVDE